MTKILHLSRRTNKNDTYPHYLLHKFLINENMDSKIVSEFGTANEKNVFKIRSRRWFELYRMILRRSLTAILRTKTREFFYPEKRYDGSYNYHSVNRILRGWRPDVIIIYWTKYAFSSKLIYKLSKKYNSSVIIVPYDMAHLTGGCHFSSGCDRYKVGCGKCPMINSSKKNDLTSKSVLYKEKYLKKFNPVIISLSLELYNQVNQSYLLKEYNNYLINFPNNYESFYYKKFSKKSNYIDTNKFNILFAASNIENKRKGFYYLEKVIRILESSTIFNKVNLIIVGEYTKKFNFNISTKYVKPVSPKDLNYLIGSSDLYLSLSIEDSGPMLLVDVIKNHIPFIAFNVGVAQDIYLKKNYKYIARNRDYYNVANYIMEIVNMNTQNYKLLLKDIHCIAVDLFDYKTQMDKFYEVIKNSVKTLIVSQEN